MTVVVALGGNALARRGEPISAEVQERNIDLAARALTRLLDGDRPVVITHGNGPQVGLLLLESEADPSVRTYPLDVLGAETEGMVGYLLEQALMRHAPHRRYATLLTQTVVAADDPAMLEPSKPVGPLYDEATARGLAVELGYNVAPDTGGWRRVVPSPKPLRLLEEEAIRDLVDNGVTVIAAGGGGVPVVVDDEGRPEGVEGVVDKDLAAVVLARTVGARTLLLLTDVDGVYCDFGTPRQARVGRLDAAGAWRLLAEGQVPRGSMAPKVEAAAGFADFGGTTLIGSLDQVDGLLAGRTGTAIEPLAHPHPAPHAGEHAGNSASASGSTRMSEHVTPARMRT
jgi:carbamate kinase